MNVYSVARALKSNEIIRGSLCIQEPNLRKRIQGALLKLDDNDLYFLHNDRDNHYDGTKPGMMPRHGYNHSWRLISSCTDHDAESWENESDSSSDYNTYERLTMFSSEHVGREILVLRNDPSSAALKAGETAKIVEVKSSGSILVQGGKSPGIKWSLSLSDFTNGSVQLQSEKIISMPSSPPSPAHITDENYLFQLYIHWDLVGEKFRNKFLYCLKDWVSSEGHQIGRKGDQLLITDIHSYGGIVDFNGGKAFFSAFDFGKLITIAEKDKVIWPLTDPTLKKGTFVTFIEDHGSLKKENCYPISYTDENRYFNIDNQGKIESLDKYDIGKLFYITPADQIPKPELDGEEITPLRAGIIPEIDEPAVKHMRPVIAVESSEEPVIKVKHHKPIVLHRED